MRTTIIQSGRHRLGTAGTVHCIRIPAVATALAEHRRSWFTALLSPARHSFAAMRSRGGMARWVPATAS
ncbi:hypothetical protein [Nocardia nova]|uniref:hypothetical protein n=1 Tax=Nocardia nova TaxID=37330 RepID=UPI00340CE548